MTGLHDGYKLYSSIYKSISVGSWKLDIKVWKEVKNWDREGCKGRLGRWAGSVGKSGRGGLYLDWFILERGHFTALGNSNEGKTLIFINIYSWWSEQEMVLQGLNLRGAEEPHLPWSHWETPVRSTLLGPTQTMHRQYPQTLNPFDPAVLSHWCWCEFRLRDQLLNYTFVPETGLDSNHFLPEFTQSDSFLALSSGNCLEGDVIIQNWFLRQFYKYLPFFCVCVMQQCLSEIFTISLLLLQNLPTFKLSRLNKLETIISMSNHKVDDV